MALDADVEVVPVMNADDLPKGFGKLGLPSGSGRLPRALRAQAQVVVALFDGVRHRPRRAGGGEADLPARPLRVPGIQSGSDASSGNVVDVAGHAHLR